MDKLVFLAFLSVHVLILSLRVVHGGTISLCSQTPYPEICNSFVRVQPQETLDKTLFGFRESAVRVTMDQAQHAHRLISGMDLSSFDPRAKLAWADCVELYEDTVIKLNRSLVHDYSTTTSLDSQTWLSAAITNQETCKDGFIEFNLTSYLKSFPNMLSDFSMLLSNALAINKAAVPLSSFSKLTNHNRRLLANGFPKWVSAGDRKLLQSPGVKANVVVAKDGSGQFTTISAAVASLGKRGGSNRFVIYVKKGVYSENVEIKESMKNLMFIGDGISATIVTGNNNAAGGTTTFRSATFGVSGDGFIARDMTFENTAGPQKHQAVALRSSSDFSIFYRCSFIGYQDTLYVYSQRQFYRDCDIYGTQDFIFGDAVVVVQSCNIYIRKPLGGANTVTAQGRSDPGQNTGIVVHNSRVTAASGFQASYKSYLGRPWKQYSRTVFIKCYLDSLIDPAGWLPWSGGFALSTLYYGEYMNTGGGADTSGRVKWPGYRVISSPSEAGKFTVGNFLAGNSWIQASGVPFTSGL